MKRDLGQNAEMQRSDIDFRPTWTKDLQNIRPTKKRSTGKRPTTKSRQSTGPHGQKADTDKIPTRIKGRELEAEARQVSR